jgi:hypothetical protein
MIPLSQRQDYFVPKLNPNKQSLLSSMIRKHIVNYQTTDDYKKMVSVPVKYQKSYNRAILEAIHICTNAPEFLERETKIPNETPRLNHEIFEPVVLKREFKNKTGERRLNSLSPDTLSILAVRKKDYDQYMGDIKFMLTMELFQSQVYHESLERIETSSSRN